MSTTDFTNRDDTDAPFYCARHPNQPTYLRCSRCETPICAKCRVSTPLGFRCYECANVQVVPTYALDSSVYLKAGVAALIVAGLIGVVMGFFPRFEFWAALIMGIAVPEAVAFGSNQKRGPGLQILGIAAIAFGFIVSRFVMGATTFFPFPSGIAFLDELPFYLTQYSILWIGLAIFLTYKRLQ